MGRTILFYFILFFSLSSCSTNVLENSGFEYWGGWYFLGGNKSEKAAHSGKFGLLVESEKPGSVGADQLIALPEETQTVHVSGWIKTEDVVKGKKPHELTLLGIDFLNESYDKLEIGISTTIAMVMGTNDWKEYTSTFRVPDGAVRMRIYAIILNATGTAYFDDIQVQLLNKAGKYIYPQKLSGPTDKGEWYEIDINPAYSASHFADWSDLLDAPAGKHGFIKTKDGDLFFENGTPAKFIGVNLVGNTCFPEKKVADSLAKRLSKMGCNLVRLHGMDADWTDPAIFKSKKNTLQLSDESLNKLDYLIYALKQKGIYIFLDLIVHREFKESDGVYHKPPFYGGKQVAYFDPTIIHLQKKYAEQLLSHINAFTKKPYKDEPAIVASGFINESTIFTTFDDDLLDNWYRGQLNKMFQKEYPGKKLSVFKIAPISELSLQLMEKRGFEGNLKESMLFLSAQERKYYSQMYQSMRNAGCKYLLAGSNFPAPILPYQKDNTVVDIIIANGYWDFPQMFRMNNDVTKLLVAPVNNTPMIKTPKNAPPQALSKFQWHKKPIIITESNSCYPNEYLLESHPFVAAYSALQGVDGLIEYDFDITTAGTDRLFTFSLSRDPSQLAQWVVAVPMLLRGDISEANGLVLDTISDSELCRLPAYSDFLDKNFHLPYITKVAKSDKPQNSNQIKDFDIYFDKKNQIITSETEELSIDFKNSLFKINTPKMQGIIGNLTNKKITLPFIEIQAANEWASVILVSKENKPLINSNSFYLVAVTPVKMKNQKYNDSRSALNEIGKLPIMAQVLEGKIKLKSNGQKAIITPLYLSGENNKPSEMKRENDSFTFDLSTYKTFVYEIKLQ